MVMRPNLGIITIVSGWNIGVNELFEININMLHDMTVFKSIFKDYT